MALSLILAAGATGSKYKVSANKEKAPITEATGSVPPPTVSTPSSGKKRTSVAKRPKSKSSASQT